MISSKTKANGISAPSFLAELSEEAELVKANAESRSLAVVGVVKRPDKVSRVLDLHSVLTYRTEPNSMGTPRC